METDSIIETQPFYLEDTPYWTPAQAEPATGVPLDSIFPVREMAPQAVRRSLFAGHAMPAVDDGLVGRQQPSAEPWVFALIVLLGAITVLYIKSRKIKFGEMLHSTVDRRVMDRMVRVYNLTPLRLMTIGLLLSGIVAVGVSQLALEQLGFLGWIAAAVALSAAYMTRWGLLRVLARVFEEEETMSAYINSGYLYHLLLAVALLPLTLLLVYMPWGQTVVLVAMAAMTTLCFAMRIVRGLKLFLTFSPTSSFFLFYYLCTVESIPAVTLIWWFFVQ